MSCQQTLQIGGLFFSQFIGCLDNHMSQNDIIIYGLVIALNKDIITTFFQPLSARPGQPT
jgi:hypothetical protein